VVPPAGVAVVSPTRVAMANRRPCCAARQKVAAAGQRTSRYDFAINGTRPHSADFAVDQHHAPVPIAQMRRDTAHSLSCPGDKWPGGLGRGLPAVSRTTGCLADRGGMSRVWASLCSSSPCRARRQRSSEQPSACRFGGSPRSTCLLRRTSACNGDHASIAIPQSSYLRFQGRLRSNTQRRETRRIGYLHAISVRLR
jgi:hypothetical protein